MKPIGAVAGGLALLFLAAVASLLSGARPGRAAVVVRVLTTGALAAGVAAGVVVLVTGTAASASIQARVPGGPWELLIDPLAAWFLVVQGGAGIAAVNFGVRYLAQEREHRGVAAAHAQLALLFAAMMLVVVAHSVVLFLIAWEVMAISAYFLILYEGHRPEVRRAGLLYLVLTHAGTLALIAMFLWWGRESPELTFGALAGAAPTLHGGGLVLLLALAGFGVKAGVVPLHVWLPGAHAAAPSHVSAVLSGVMLKIGIYGLLRVIGLLGTAPLWFGWTLFGLGLVSGLLGVLWALAQHDLKRVLAYSSVENVGIILLGIGLGVLGLGLDRPLLAGLGILAALAHVLNHSLMKSLLFLGAGAVVHATGIRAIDRLGGLIRQVPLTTAGFAIGAVAIAGLPPLNGFVSEWITAQALLRGSQASGPAGLIVVGVAGLGLIGALAVACFARIVGMVFLGQPRDAAVTAPHDDRGLAVPMAGLAVICLVAGLWPAATVGPAALVVPTIAGAPAAEAAIAALDPWLPGPATLAFLLGGLAVLTWSLRRRATRARTPGQAPTWGCAYPAASARMQYTGSSFGMPLLRGFGRLGVPGPVPAGDPVATDPTDPVLAGVVLPLARAIRSVAGSVRRLQDGRITRSLQYMVLTLLILLGALFAASGAGP